MSRGVALAEPLRVGSLKGALPKGTDQAGGALTPLTAQEAVGER